MLFNIFFVAAIPLVSAAVIPMAAMAAISEATLAVISETAITTASMDTAAITTDFVDTAAITVAITTTNTTTNTTTDANMEALLNPEPRHDPPADSNSPTHIAGYLAEFTECMKNIPDPAFKWLKQILYLDMAPRRIPLSDDLSGLLEYAQFKWNQTRDVLAADAPTWTAVEGRAVTTAIFNAAARVGPIFDVINTKNVEMVLDVSAQRDVFKGLIEDEKKQMDAFFEGYARKMREAGLDPNEVHGPYGMIRGFMEDMCKGMKLGCKLGMTDYSW